eukprot:evm.model.scf_131.3 EVM.evm.TU.scf_131.3   scf_131:17231-19237(-)
MYVPRQAAWWLATQRVGCTGPGVGGRLAHRATRLEVTKTRDSYEELLEKAREKTATPPPGQLHGRAGRRSALEDGERMLGRCIKLCPTDWRPHFLLMHNLMEQGRGREVEVPVLAMRAIELCGASIDVDVPGTVEEVKEIVQCSVAVLQENGCESDVQRFVQALCTRAPHWRELLQQMTQM